MDDRTNAEKIPVGLLATSCTVTALLTTWRVCMSAQEGSKIVWSLVASIDSKWYVCDII